MGFFLAALYFYFADPSWRLIATGGIVALGGLLLRGWATGIIRKDNQLAVTGPYALTRNPLYLGSFIVGMGFCVAGGRLVFLLIFWICFGFIYRAVIRREEAHLARLFPVAYAEYRQRVPAFVPRWPRMGLGQSEFAWPQYWRNREYQAGLGFGGALLLLIIKLWLFSRS